MRQGLQQRAIALSGLALMHSPAVEAYSRKGAVEVSDPILVIFFMAAALSIVLGRLLPRLGAWLFGPALLVLAAVFFVKAWPLFFPSQPDGTTFSLSLVAVMWILLLAVVFYGVALIATGLKSRQEEKSREEEG